MFGFGKSLPRPPGRMALELKVISFDILPPETSNGPVPSGTASPYRVNLVDEQGRKYFITYYVSSLPPDAYQNHTLDQIRASDIKVDNWYRITGEVSSDGQIIIADTGTITADLSHE